MCLIISTHLKSNEFVYSPTQQIVVIVASLDQLVVSMERK